MSFVKEANHDEKICDNITRADCNKLFCRDIGLEHKGLHAFRHTFATRLINGVKQPDGTIKSLPVKQVADLLGHTTSEITEIYYVKRDNSRLMGLTDGFEL
ncbi:MAG: tyrosine-type recombinase/integrase [Ruminococcus sp.]|nr:tyrosine-type recombinase/integrase [Ruminococcus sp.]